ncbi:HGL022Wp [Eremothecium sinecaudum]|uniref:HGL022Wp n=1 Tax=Eremothecium sinecaudum TaxID=45286 RepID=A0A109V017_9SACH|nr:HGL022Wp [Eremothecium sinecaudum]AMD22318.1 HGL022Wp [Eremothecium sinecaudum]
MLETELQAPIPLKHKKISELRDPAMKLTRSSSSSGDLVAKRAKLLNVDRLAGHQIQRPRSTTPMPHEPVNTVSAETLVEERVKRYNLDYATDKEEHEKNIYDPKSCFYSRQVKPKFSYEENLPYATENHKEQAKYLCHILVNLYIAINSLDIQGLISITSKDLADFKSELDVLALNTDLFRLTNNEDGLELNDITNYDEDEDDDDDGSQDYYDEEEEDSSYDFGSSGKITAKSSTVVNVNHWTNELKNCLHFDFPLSIRKSLAIVYYHLSLVQGQKIYRQMHVNMFESLVSQDDNGTNFSDLLYLHGLRLDYKPMLAFLSEFLPCPEADYVRYDISSKADLQLFRLLLKLAHQSKMFYDENDEKLLHNTMDRFIASFSPHTLPCVLPIITSFVPYHYSKDRNILDYFPFLFNVWSSVSASVVFDIHLYDLTGCVANDAYLRLIKEQNPRLQTISGIGFGPHGIFTENQIDFIMNRIQNHLKDDFQIHSYSKTVRPLIYSMNGSCNSGFFSKLTSLIKSIMTFVHPSNNGQWTKVIAKFIHALFKMYHERWVSEQKLVHGYRKELWLSPECHASMVDLFSDVLFLGSQNKDTDTANYYISSFAYILDIKPNNAYKIFDKVLVDLYDSLTDQFINSVHRVISSLKQFTRIVRYMVIDPLYRIHITNIFSMIVTKLGTNDLTLTSNAINSIVSLCAYIPLDNFVTDSEYLTFASHTVPFIQEHVFFLKDGGKSCEFNPEEETLKQVFVASTTEFENILKVYVEKLFELVDADLEDRLLTKINQTTMIMMESMSDKMFKYFIKLLLKEFWDTDAFKSSNPNYDLVTIPMGAAVRRDNGLSKQLFTELVYNLKEQLDRGAGSIRSSSEIQSRDVKLVAYLTALNDVIRQSHEALLTFKDELLDLLKFVHSSINNPPLDVITSVVLHYALSSLTTIEITEYRLFPDGSNLSMAERWGGLQFDDRKYDTENCKFKWHVPTSEEVDFAIYLLETLTTENMKKVEEMMRKPVKDAAYVDQLKKCILIISHALSGISLLFDPDFNSNKEKGDSQLTDPIKRKFYLLKQLRDKNCDNNELMLDIEQIRDDSIDDDMPQSGTDKSDEFSNEIDIRETNPAVHELDMPDDADMSEVPSGVATPAPGAHFDGSTSAMNCSIAFRDLEIFTCSYFFGNTNEEKFGDDRYIKVHLIRSNIGRFLHTLFKFLRDNFSHNQGVFQILLYGMKVWFTDVGQETIFKSDPTSFLDLEFLENLQTLSHYVSEPFTRTYLAADLNAHHDARVMLRSTNRVPSKLEVVLMKDIIDLAISVYPDIHNPAQGTMVHAMKQLIGSYSLTINKIIKEFKSALEKEDYRKIEVLIAVLSIKKIHRKLISDYKNLSEIIFLLLSASKINHLEIAVIADRLLDSLVNALKIPSSVCIIDIQKMEVLNPNDPTVDVQVDAVKKAKKAKRDHFYALITNLQDRLIEYLKDNAESGWRISYFIIKFVTKVQSSLEFKPDARVLSAIFNLTKTKHPVIVHLAISSFVSICNKIQLMGDYEYDIKKAYTPSFTRRYVEVQDTSEKGFPDRFKEEMSNFESPNYFIDSIGYIGWMSWGPPLKVVKNVDQIDMHLKPEDFEILKIFGNMITVDWLKELATIFIQDNETRGMFSNTNVSFFALIFHLIANDISAVTYDDMLSLCRNFYNKNDKTSMIMSIEIFAAILTSKKVTAERDLLKWNEFLTEFLQYCLDRDLNQDSTYIWNMLCWWIPTYMDVRRVKPLFSKLTKDSTGLDKELDTASDQVFRLSLLRNMLAIVEYRSPYLEPIFSELILDHPYHQVREEIAKLMCCLIQTRISPSASNVEELLERSSKGNLKKMPAAFHDHICGVFKTIETERIAVKDLTSNGILKTKYFYMASTMLYFIAHMMKSPNQTILVPYVTDYIAPFLLNLQKLREMCKLAGISPGSYYTVLAYMPLSKDQIPEFVSLLGMADLSSSNEIRTQLLFAENLYSRHMLQMTQCDRERILKFVVDSMYNENFIEVRNRASEVLSGIVHNLNEESKLPDLIDTFNIHLKKNASNKNKNSDSTIHGSIIGLGAIISAFPYEFPLPKWIPGQLSNLATWARTSGISGSAAKDIISTFKKVRADTWYFDRDSFTPDQLEDLEGVLWRSYYA